MQLGGFEIGRVIAPPEAREISGGLEPLQASFLCVLMDSRPDPEGTTQLGGD